MVAVLLYDNRLTSISIVVLLDDNRLIAVAIPFIVARPDCYANGPNTDPAPAGITLQIPATAAITTASRVIIMCSYHYETLRGQPREVANCSGWVRDSRAYMGEWSKRQGC
jgi:hypothetical protein